MPIRPRILVALDEDGVTTRDEEPGGRVARKVVVERARLALVLVTQGRLGGARSSRDGEVARRIVRPSPAVVVAETADEEPGIDAPPG
jgi:hypothetical protein